MSANRELLLLAQPLKDRRRVDPYNYFVSAKLDGVRALWEPSTIGKPVGDIPWANRARDSRDHIATGLWSRYAKPIFAPSWFTDRLPRDICLDGELWSGRQSFNKIVSAVKKLVPVDSEWGTIGYMIFDSPTYKELYRNGKVNGINYKMQFADFVAPLDTFSVSSLGYEFMYHTLSKMNFGDHAYVHKQFRCANWDEVDFQMEAEIALGGEGLMLRRMNSVWIPKRDMQLIKLKPWSDSEGVVIGWTPGIGKYQGMTGSLKVQMPDGKRFDLSGFTDEERRLTVVNDTEVPMYYRIGDTVTYKYRELTPDGLPKEARYHRKHEDV